MRYTLLSTLRTRRFMLVLVVLVITVVAAVAAAAQRASGAVTTLKTFTTPGTYIWAVPTGVTNATFNVFGASGGGVVSVNHNIVTVISQGGAGGQAKANFVVHAGEVFEIVVGGQGTTATGSIYGMGGDNGGANGSYYGGGGGGGSDVRIGGRGNACAVAKTCGFENRIVVGGGGGGGGNGATLNGGGGGGVTAPGGGGTQQSGGICDPYDGGFGFGSESPSGEWGGGGGGWYGGCTSSTSGVASGGSGYISAVSKSGSFPGGTNSGDGKVIITTS